MKQHQEILDQFKHYIGENVTYEKKGKFVCNGEVKDVRLSDTYITDLNDPKNKRYGIQLKMKPTNNYNGGKAFWTISFDTQIPIENKQG